MRRREKGKNMKHKKTAAALALLLSLTQLAGCDKAIQEADGQNSENALTESGGNENETETESAAEAETDEEPQSEDISDDPQLITLRERIRQSGLPVGLAYIGYIGNDASEEELRNLVADSAYAAPYAFLKNAPIVGAEGAELYAVVTMADCAISVYPITLADDGALTADGDILRQSDGGDCFLLRCNVSDIVPNIECEIKAVSSYTRSHRCSRAWTDISQLPACAILRFTPRKTNSRAKREARERSVTLKSRQSFSPKPRKYRKDSARA